MNFKKKIFIGLLAGISALSFLSIGFLEYLLKDLPTITTLIDYKPALVTKVFSSDKELIGELYAERRAPLNLKEISEYVKTAFVAAEDADFYRHPGINFTAILRALIKNILAGGVVQGGSTITQQVTRSIILSRERTFTRKIKEMILSYRLEKYLTKDEILGLYLNQVFLGNNSSGVEMASETFFHKPVRTLTLAEAAFLAGLPKAPSRYNPFKNPELVKSRQEYVLKRMLEESYITKGQYTEAYNQPLLFYKYMSPNRIAPYPLDAIQEFLRARVGGDLVDKGGLRVFTTFKAGYQRAAEAAVVNGIRALDKRQGFRGPDGRWNQEELPKFLEKIADEFRVQQESAKIYVDKDGKIKTTTEEKLTPVIGNIYTGIVTRVDSKEDIVEIITGNGKGVIALKDMEWAHRPNTQEDISWAKIKDPAEALKTGDIVKVKLIGIKKDIMQLTLEQEPVAEAAFLAMEAETCKILAMVGGYNYVKSQFNRALQAHRQSGSAAKPLLYAAAIEKGYTPSSQLLDAPITFDTGEEWKPHNYDDTFSGPILFRKALVVSRNNPTVRLLWDIGIDYFIEYLKRMGIEEILERNLSIGLGSFSVTPLNLLKAYNVFPSGGYLCSTGIMVERVEDWNGRLLYDYTIDENIPSPAQVVSPQIAYIVTSMLEAVVEEGTGWRAKALGRPSAGKTGTTNEFKDAWYIGYIPQLIAAAWVGMDDYTPIGKGETGARAASPIWVEFMEHATRNLPVKIFSVPPGIVFSKIDPVTGLRATNNTTDPIFQAYLEGTEPQEYSNDINDKRDRMKLEEEM
ncbi:MAG TPA: PBP1A family penicillin-binding protein [bacterium]